MIWYKSQGDLIAFTHSVTLYKKKEVTTLRGDYLFLVYVRYLRLEEKFTRLSVMSSFRRSLHGCR